MEYLHISNLSDAVTKNSSGPTWIRVPQDSELRAHVDRGHSGPVTSAWDPLGLGVPLEPGIHLGAAGVWLWAGTARSVCLGL